MTWEAVLLQPIENPTTDNVDVVVKFADGRKYGATFFTLRSIEELMENWSTTGECGSGFYFWSRHPIVVRSLSQASVAFTIESLLASGEFEGAFELLNPNDETDLDQ